MDSSSRQNIMQAILRNLKGLRKVKDIQTFDQTVSFTLHGKVYFVVGQYPELQAVCHGKVDVEMTQQLNFVPARKRRIADSYTPLRDARMTRGLQLKQVADDLDIDQGNLSRIERGLQTPNIQLAKRIAEYFDNTITTRQICQPKYKEKSNV